MQQKLCQNLGVKPEFMFDENRFRNPRRKAECMVTHEKAHFAFHLNSWTCASISFPVSYPCQVIKEEHGFRTNQCSLITMLISAQSMNYRQYSSCEPWPQQDFSFRLMCFISFSEGNLYFITCIHSQQKEN